MITKALCGVFQTLNHVIRRRRDLDPLLVDPRVLFGGQVAHPKAVSQRVMLKLSANHYSIQPFQ